MRGSLLEALEYRCQDQRDWIHAAWVLGRRRTRGCMLQLTDTIQYPVTTGRTPNPKDHDWKHAYCYVQQTMPLLSDRAPQLCNVHQSNHTIRPSYSIVQCPTRMLYLHTFAGGNKVRGQLPGTQTPIQRDRPTTTALGRSSLDLPRQ